MVACHKPVLLNEVLENLVVNANGVYVDATFGRGGHAQAILDRIGPTGRLLAMDKDPEAVAYAKQHFAHDSRFMIQHGSFTQLEKFVTHQQVHGHVTGILFDLGVSSPQLDTPDRGFSFMRAGQLDMRMDSSQGMDAATWLARVGEKELADVLWTFGEERHSRRIAHAIVAARQEQPITTTERLAEIVKVANPAWQIGKHPATRSFQAIRIFINQELEELQKGLAQSLEALAIKGRLVVISFHSLEDRLVKHFIQRHERGDDFPVDFPVRQDQCKPRLKRLGRAIKPSDKEIAENLRARSAVLRIAEKLV